jgi:polar amino acid transport system substrate-binding protein
MGRRDEGTHGKQTVVILLAVLLSVFLCATNGVAGKLLEEIKQRGKIIVGTESALVPFEFIRDGKLVGYDIDLVRIMAERLGVTVEHVDLPWQGILPGLFAGKFDLVATAVVMTEERKKQVLFTVPYAEATSTVVVRKGDTRIKAPEDLIGKVVAVQLNSGHHFAAKRLDERLQKEKGAHFKELKTYTTYAEIFLDLTNGRIDAGVASLPVLSVLMQEKPDQYQMGLPIAEKLYYGWALRKEDVDLQQAINKMFIDLKQSGKLAELQRKWFGFIMDTPNE